MTHNHSFWLLQSFLFCFSPFYFCLIFNRICRKIIGLGFAFGPNPYLKNSWNWLDFSVVIIGYLSFVGVNNLSALRTFRVLRPLRTLTTVPGMKVIVVSMISALPALSGVSQTTDPLLYETNKNKQRLTRHSVFLLFYLLCTCHRWSCLRWVCFLCGQSLDFNCGVALWKVVATTHRRGNMIFPSYVVPVLQCHWWELGPTAM